MVTIFDQLMLEASPNSEFQNKKRRDSPIDRESRAALMYLKSKKLAPMRKANIAKISLLIFIIEPSIWRLRHGSKKILQGVPRLGWPLSPFAGSGYILTRMREKSAFFAGQEVIFVLVRKFRVAG